MSKNCCSIIKSIFDESVEKTNDVFFNLLLKLNTLNTLQFIAQIIVAVSVYYVWIFRYPVIMREFKQFGLSEVTRTFVGTVKVSFATLLIVGICYPPIIPIGAIGMGFFMLSAQFFHFKIKNTFIKHLPSLIFLILCIFITLNHYEII